MFSPEEIARYSSQIILPEIGAEGQKKLQKAKVLILGCGGLGSAVSLYLATAGIGKMILIDKDNLELSNLQRQVLYSNEEIGKKKVELAKKRLQNINPHLQIQSLTENFNFFDYKKGKKNDFADCDLILDCSDNVMTKKSLNFLSLYHKIPIVFASAIRWSGCFFSMLPKKTACYDCVYPQSQAEDSCDEAGILGSVVGILGSMQSLEAIKILLGKGKNHFNKMFFFDGLHFQNYTMELNKNKDCPSCN